MLVSTRATNVLLILVLAVGIAIAAMLASGVRGGPLDPPGPPGPTMKTLDEVPPSWSRTLAANDGAPGPNPPAGCNSSRFACVMNNEGVLDRETGLVWMRNADIGSSSQPLAQLNCLYATAGQRRGWRLPSPDELLTLVDTVTGGLPQGHPFQNVQVAQSQLYWTSTEWVQGMALTFYFFSGDVSTADRTFQNHAWCVRGVGDQGEFTAAT